MRREGDGVIFLSLWSFRKEIYRDESLNIVEKGSYKGGFTYIHAGAASVRKILVLQSQQ